MSQFNKPIGKLSSNDPNQSTTIKQQKEAAILHTYLIDLVSINLADVIGSRLGLFDHFEGDRGKYAVLTPLPAKVGTTSPRASLRIRVAAKAAIETCRAAKTRPAHVRSRVEKACILTREL